MTLPEEAARLLGRIDPSAMRLGLAAPRRLLGALGDPQRGYATVLVAGTNGKGSTAAWLAAMAVAAGYRTGLYTSPHLETVEERVRVDGLVLPGEELGRWLVAAAGAAEAVLDGPPTYFELVTAAAMAGFAAAGVELAVLEVGMGGRLDATNVAEPVLSVITEIGLDHERHLGPAVAEIAAEKAGILRRGRPAIAGCSHPEALAAVRRTAAARGARLEVATETASWRRGAAGAIELETPGGRHRLAPALAGEHQRANLVLAVLAAEELARGGWSGMDRRAIAAGAERCRWPGRLESVRLPRRELVLDVAHNPDGARSLAAHLANRGEPYDLLFGTLDDKRGEEMLPPLAAAAGRIVLTRPAGDRGLEPAALATLVPAGRAAIVEPAPGRALERALDGSSPLLVVCGSFYLVGEIRGLLTRRFGVPSPAAAVPSC